MFTAGLFRVTALVTSSLKVFKFFRISWSSPMSHALHSGFSHIHFLCPCQGCSRWTWHRRKHMGFFAQKSKSWGSLELTMSPVRLALQPDPSFSPLADRKRPMLCGFASADRELPLFRNCIQQGLEGSWSGSDICVLKSQRFIWEAAFHFIIMHISLTQPVKTVIWTLRALVWTHYATFLGPSRLWLGTRRRWKSIGKLGNVFNKRKNISQLWLNADTSHFHRQLYTHYMGYGTNRCKRKIFYVFFLVFEPLLGLRTS